MTNDYSDTPALTFLHVPRLCGCLVLAVRHLYLRTIVKLRCDKNFHLALLFIKLDMVYNSCKCMQFLVAFLRREEKWFTKNAWYFCA